MAAIENFVLKIKVEGQKAVDDLKKSVNDLGTTISGFGANAGKITSAISGIVGSMGGLVGIAGTAATAFVGLGLRAINLADDLGDISDATGIAAGSLNNLRNSLVLAGGKAEDFGTLAAKLNQNVGDAAIGGEKAQKAFQKLGVYVTDAGGNVRDTGDILRDAIARLAAIEDPATRAALAVELFGKTANKLDFTKLNAANDFAKDDQIAQLAKYKEAIDKIGNAVNDSLITMFGKLAIKIDEAQKKAAQASKEAESRGMVRDYDIRTGLPFERPMKPAEKAAKDKRDYEQSMAAAMSAYKTRAPAETPAKGGFGATPEATLKAIAESEKRLRQSTIDANRNAALKGANEIQAIEINAAAEIAKAREEIFAKERLSTAQKGAEFAAKKAEIESKAAIDTAKARSQLNAKVFAEEEAQRQKIAEELAAEDKRINDIIESSRRVVTEIANQNAELAARAKFSLDTAMMTDTERANAQALFDIEQQRLVLLKQIADIKDLPYADRIAKEQEINALLNKRKEDAIANQAAQRAQSEDFAAGWDRAYRQYVENSRNSFQQAEQLFSTLNKGFGDSIVNFVQTGKLSFRSLFNDLIAQAVRISANRLLMSILGGMGGTGGIGGFFGSLFGGFRAEGGPVSAGTPYVVGEKGPEVFVPRNSGNIIPNGAVIGGGQSITNVTYSIQAVDASSFRQLVARDPEFIFNVTEQGRRQLPSRSRR